MEAYLPLTTISWVICMERILASSEELTQPIDFLSSRISVLPNNWPNTLMLPVVGQIYPLSIFSRVVLPEPLSPSIAQCCPFITFQLTCFRIVFLSLLQETSSIVMIFSILYRLFTFYY